MKINELMIGDLVRVDCPFILKTQKADYSIHGICRVSNIDCTDDDNTIEVEEQEGTLIRGNEITPIPLTKKMLELNGFINGYHRCYTLYGAFDVWDINGELQVCIASRFVKKPFVHQLQQLLRIADFVDTADNFKLE